MLEKAIIVGANYNNVEFEYELKELENLVEACDIEVLYTLTQAINKISSRLYIGSGKVEEIKEFVTNLDATLVIFNVELSGSQIKNLENELKIKVIDRTLLILDIFAKRAKTKEAMLEVEIAQLEYIRPRLSGLGDSLNRQQGGIGSRGPGEKKLELDRRKILNEISTLKTELKAIENTRELQRKKRQRSKIRKAAIVGYTNSGKSTLLNTFVKFTSDDESRFVLEKDMLFATLDPSTRLVKLDNNKEFIITDTVGFVSNLPHHLVESFKSTLEEIKDADLIIHVVDASNIYQQSQIDTTKKVLDDLGASNIETIYLYNKQDLKTNNLTPLNFPFLEVSLKDDNDVEKILKAVENEIFKDYEAVELLIPYSKSDLVAFLNQNSNVLTQEYIEKGTLIIAELSPILKGRYREYINKKDENN